MAFRGQYSSFYCSPRILICVFQFSTSNLFPKCQRVIDGNLTGFKAMDDGRGCAHDDKNGNFEELTSYAHLVSLMKSSV